MVLQGWMEVVALWPVVGRKLTMVQEIVNKSWGPRVCSTTNNLAMGKKLKGSNQLLGPGLQK